jgi:hypothetical protein
MAKSNQFSAAMLNLILNGTPISGLADNAATSPNTNLYLALHTADPGASGTQATGEVAYTGYARQPLSRAAGSWTVSGNQATTNTTINFPANTGATTVTAAFASIGVAATGATMLLWSGQLSNSITINQGTLPVINQGSAITES